MTDHRTYMTPLMFTSAFKPWNAPERRVTRKACAHHVKLLLGIGAKDHWPVDGIPMQTVQGHNIYVTPARNDGRRKHRAFAVCKCGKHVPVGRMFSHLC